MISLFKKKEIPSKNYYIVIIVTILVVLLMIFIKSFYTNYTSSKLSESIFSNQVINQINIDDFDYVLPEISESIIFVSYSNNNEIYNMEKKLYKELEKNNQLDNIIFLDVSNYLNNNEYIKILKSKFSNIENEINSAPMFIYIKDGVAVEAMSSELKMVDYKIYKKMIDKYGIE